MTLISFQNCYYFQSAQLAATNVALDSSRHVKPFWHCYMRQVTLLQDITVTLLQCHFHRALHWHFIVSWQQLSFPPKLDCKQHGILSLYWVYWMCVCYIDGAFLLYCLFAIYMGLWWGFRCTFCKHSNYINIV